MSRRPQAKRHTTMREREQHDEMERQKKFMGALAYYPQERLCQPCQTRDPWVDLCPACRAKIKEYAGV